MGGSSNSSNGGRPHAMLIATSSSHSHSWEQLQGGYADHRGWFRYGGHSSTGLWALQMNRARKEARLQKGDLSW